MDGFSTKPAFRVNLGYPDRAEIFREIDRENEEYYEMHVYRDNGISQSDKNEMFGKAVAMILTVGGELREDWRCQMQTIFYTLPAGVANPVHNNDPQYRGLVFTRMWPKYTLEERIVFGLDKVETPPLVKDRRSSKKKKKTKAKAKTKVKDDDEDDYEPEDADDENDE